MFDESLERFVDLPIQTDHVAARAQKESSRGPGSRACSGRPRTTSRSRTRRRGVVRSSSQGSGSEQTPRSSRATKSTSASPARCTRAAPASSSRKQRKRHSSPRSRRGPASSRSRTPLDDRAQARPRPAAATRGAAASRRRRPVGGRDPGRSRRRRLLHRLGAEMALRAGADGRAVRARSGAASRRAAERVLTAELRDRRLVRPQGRRTAVRFGLDRLAEALRASRRRSGCIRTGGTRRRPRRLGVASCSRLLRTS